MIAKTPIDPVIVLGSAKILLALQEMPWGKKISEGDFLHFVLPLRVNNENLDDFLISHLNININKIQ